MLNEGGCLCGNVRYETIGPPTNVTICHCRFCQRATGSIGMVQPVFLREKHRIIKGETAKFNLKSGGSSKVITVNFCSSCGTKVHLEFERFPNAVGVYAGTFDDPNWFEQTPANTKYIFLESAPKGTVVRAGYNAFDGHARLNDDTPLVPTVHNVHFAVRD